MQTFDYWQLLLRLLPEAIIVAGALVVLFVDQGCAKRLALSKRSLLGMSLSAANKHEPVLGRGASSITESAPGFAVHLAEVEVLA